MHKSRASSLKQLASDFLIGIDFDLDANNVLKSVRWKAGGKRTPSD